MEKQFISLLVTIGKSKKHINYTANVSDITRLEGDTYHIKGDDRRIRAVYPELAAEELKQARAIDLDVVSKTLDALKEFDRDLQELKQTRPGVYENDCFDITHRKIEEVIIQLENLSE